MQARITFTHVSLQVNYVIEVDVGNEIYLPEIEGDLIDMYQIPDEAYFYFHHRDDRLEGSIFPQSDMVIKWYYVCRGDVMNF